MLETSWAVNKIGRKTYNENYYSKPHKTLSTISNEFPHVFRFAAKLTI